LQPNSLSQALGKVHHSHSLPNPNTLRSSISKYGSAVELLGGGGNHTFFSLKKSFLFNPSSFAEMSKL